MDVFDRASKMVSDLCNGRKRWIMSIPVDEERDPDVVIGKAIRAGVDAQADADRRGELLKRYDEGLQREPDCFSCGIMAFNEDTEKWEHADDCELAKELADDLQKD